MRTLLPLLTFAAIAMPPLQAQAQVYPERVRSVVRTATDKAAPERYQRGRPREEQTERFTRTFALGAEGALDIGNVSGDIVITRATGKEVTLEVVKTAHSPSGGDAREQLALVPVDITERAGRVEVRVRYPRGEQTRGHQRQNINVSVAFTVTAPEGTRITARSISGSISARDIRGDLTLDSISGNVRITNGARIPSAKSISGNVEIADTALEGSLDASSISGNLELRKVTARRLSLSTVSGNLILQDVSCEMVDARSVSGDVRFSGPLARGGRYELRSHSGEIRVGVDGTTGFAVEASSFSGGIRTDMALVLKGADTERGRRQRTLRGTFGDGSAVLALTSFSGSIVISKR